MRRAILHLLLSLSLVFNAVAAPWAMAGMHAEDQVPPQADSARSMAAPDHSAHHGHGHGAHADRVATDAPDRVDAAPAPHAVHAHDDGSCCNGALCSCGCILAPALPFAAAPALAAVPGAQSCVLPPQPRVAVRATPPFRPPAV